MKIIEQEQAHIGSGYSSLGHVLDDDEQHVCTLYTNSAIDAALGGKVLLFGQFATTLPEVTLEAAIRSISAFAKSNGQHSEQARNFSQVIGPIEGSTWRSYRAIIDSSAEDFPGNVVSHPHLATVLERNHYERLSTYVSCEIDRLGVQDQLAQRKPDATFSKLNLESLSGKDFVDLLPQLYVLVSTTFSRNHLYSPISYDIFRKMYLPLQALADAGLVRIARYEKANVGLVLMLKDQHTLVVKTMGRLPGALLQQQEIPSAQLGGAMAYACYEYFLQTDAQRLVMALMHVDNPSYHWGRTHGGRVCFTYGLYSLVLADL